MNVRTYVSMFPPTWALALILAAPLTLAGETPLDVDAHKVLALAAAAVSERFPEISADDLTVDGNLEFQCWLTRPNETVLALEGARAWREAKPLYLLLRRWISRRDSTYP